MNAKSNKNQHSWKILVALLFVICFASASGAMSTSAAKLTSMPTTESAVDAVRQHMLDIAYL
jgi:hypothetical protein